MKISVQRLIHYVAIFRKFSKNSRKVGIRKVCARFLLACFDKYHPRAHFRNIFSANSNKFRAFFCAELLEVYKNPIVRTVWPHFAPPFIYARHMGAQNVAAAQKSNKTS